MSEIDANPDAIAGFLGGLVECRKLVELAQERLEGLPPVTWCDDTVGSARDAVTILRDRCGHLSQSLSGIIAQVSSDLRNALGVLDTEQGGGL